MKPIVPQRVTRLLDRMVSFLDITKQKSFTAKDIRDLRVHIKRWKAYTVLITKEVLREREELTVLYELDKHASKVRKYDVMMEMLSQYSSNEMAPLIKKLKKKQKKKTNDFLDYTQAIKRKKFMRSIAALMAEFTLPTAAKLKRLFHKYLTINYRAIGDILSMDEVEDEVLHTIRRWVKEITYSAMFVLGGDHTFAQTLKHSGKLLGEWHDQTELIVLLNDQQTKKSFPTTKKMLLSLNKQEKKLKQKIIDLHLPLFLEKVEEYLK